MYFKLKIIQYLFTDILMAPYGVLTKRQTSLI